MREHKKPFKFYLYMFIFAIILVTIYTIYSLTQGDVVASDLIVMWLLPFIFVGFYYGFDSLMDRFSKKKNKINYEVKFLEAISERMRNSNEFLVEDYRKLQINEKFQKALRDAYHIHENGEDELYNFQRLEKKFRKDTIEYKAIQYVISFVQEKQENGKTE